MCRNIKTLFNNEPPATETEIRASAHQFVGKVGGTTKPSKINEAAFEHAIDEISDIVRDLLSGLVTNAAAKDRAEQAAKARARAARRSA